jgi:hypothetical protein
MTGEAEKSRHTWLKNMRWAHDTPMNDYPKHFNSYMEKNWELYSEIMQQLSQV